MKQYKLKSNGFDKTLKRVETIYLFGMVIPYLSLCLCVGLNKVMVIMGILLIILVGFVVPYLLKLQNSLFESFTVSIDEADTITREQSNTPPIRIPKSEISEIIIHKDGSMQIRGDNKHTYIEVSAQIENRDDLENHLRTLKAIQPFTMSLVMRVKMEIFIVVLTTPMLIVLFSETKTYIVSAGICAIIQTPFPIRRWYRNAQIGTQNLKIIYWGMIGQIMTILLFMCSKLY
jgi:hypothetical protein